MSFPKELSELLYEKVGFSEKELSDYFTLDENEKDWILTLKPNQWLERKTYGAMQGLARAYDKNGPSWWIPKGREAEVPQTKESKPSKSNLQGKLSPAKTIEVPLKSLIYGKYSPRYKANARGLKKPKVDREHVDRLLDALKAGEKLPVPKVRPYERNTVMKEPLYEVVDGEHTCMAYERFGLGKIEVALKPLSHLEALCGALEWNLRHGLPVTHLQEARQIERMLNECEGVTQDQVAKRLNRSPAWVSNRMALLKVTGEEFTRVKSGHARAIVTAPEEVRPKIAEKVEREEIPVRPTTELVEKVKEGKKAVLEIPYNKKPQTCFVCGLGTHFPTPKDGKPLCLDCVEDPDLEEKFKAKLKAKKPSPPPKVEKTKYVPIERWEDRERKRHPKDSKIQLEVFQELQEEGWNIGTDEEAQIPLPPADGLEKNIAKPCFVHGPHHRKDRQREWDKLFEEVLRRLGREPSVEWCERYSEKRKEEIKAKFRQDFIEGYVAKGLPLPPKVQKMVNG